MSRLLSTKEVARHLGVNEKMVYSLISEKGLPASKVTGKWVFPQHLVDQWVEAHTINLAAKPGAFMSAEELLIISGSNDPLLEQTIGLYNGLYPERLAVFGNVGSVGGIRGLKQGLCHIATSHLLQEKDEEYNFEAVGELLNPVPVVVNFCRRRQGLIVAKGNPRRIGRTSDLGQPGLRLVNRKLGTGTRQLLDRELSRAGLNGDQISGYTHEVQRHMDVGLAVLGGKADAGPGIQPVAELLGLDFMAWRWERYDLLIQRERFFDQSVQLLLGLLHESRFQRLAEEFQGYDLSMSGKMVFPKPQTSTENNPSPKPKEES
ncbi:MAG: helix-turn-helix transcriptional regulator [Desulfobacteraceae bacterium]|nr:helix-turn-helix transcriptional regulator [Desulfobacteraceae bacterium]